MGGGKKTKAPAPAKAASPDDVAEVAVWLVEGADLVTGESILVDAGLHLGKQLRDRFPAVSGLKQILWLAPPKCR